MSKNTYERWIDDLLSRRAIAFVVLVFVVVTGLLLAWRPAKEFAEDMGWRAAPRAAAPQVPIGSVDPARLVAINESIELYSGDKPVLMRDGEPVVVFTFEGIDRNGELVPGQWTLLAQFGVKVLDRSIGPGLIDSYVTVESVYDREIVKKYRASALVVVEGDVLTVLGEHRFKVQRLWHSEHMGRPSGDPQTSVLLVAIR